MGEVEVVPDSETVVGYRLHGNCYLNVTNRCTLRCSFCPKFNGQWEVQGYNMRLRHMPTAEEMKRAVGDPAAYEEIVFCGMGEPTHRLYTVLEVANALRARGARRIRLNTDGLANERFGRDVTPDMESSIDALSVSLNAQNEHVYNRHCRPPIRDAYRGVIEFVKRAREFVPDVTLTAVSGLDGVDIPACERIARALGVKFRQRDLGKIG